MATLGSQKNGDVVFLRNLTLSAVVGADAWERPKKAQPVIIDLRLNLDISAAAAQDAVEHTLNYGALCKDITRLVQGGEPGLTLNGTGKEWAHLEALAAILCYVPFRTAQETNGIAIRKAELTITLPKGALLAEGGVGLSWVMESTGPTNIEARHEQQRLFVRAMKMAVIIGVNPHERLDKQQVVVDLTLSDIKEQSPISRDYHDLIRTVSRRVDASSFKTLEALALEIAGAAFEAPGFDGVTVAVQKPSALAFVAGAGVELSRTRADFEHTQDQGRATE